MSYQGYSWPWNIASVSTIEGGMWFPPSMLKEICSHIYWLSLLVDHRWAKPYEKHLLRTLLLGNCVLPICMILYLQCCFIVIISPYTYWSHANSMKEVIYILGRYIPRQHIFHEAGLEALNSDGLSYQGSHWLCSAKWWWRRVDGRRVETLPTKYMPLFTKLSKNGEKIMRNVSMWLRRKNFMYSRRNQ